MQRIALLRLEGDGANRDRRDVVDEQDGIVEAARWGCVRRAGDPPQCLRMFVGDDFTAEGDRTGCAIGADH